MAVFSCALFTIFFSAAHGFMDAER